MISTAARMLAAAAALIALPAAAQNQSPQLASPVQCDLGVNCFVQQYPDMMPGSGAVDPLCGPATYDGHDGTDIRVLSLKDMSHGVKVIAMAGGVVLRLRDGVPDRLITSQAQSASVSGRECGNGLVIDHGGGLEAQYCHLKQGSVSVVSGQHVGKGDMIGEIGASGMAQFPHVHVTVRKNGQPVDPLTGQALSDGCADADQRHSLWEPELEKPMTGADGQIVALGITDGPIDHDKLTVRGPPEQVTAGARAVVGWAWFLNLRQGDRIKISVAGPSGETIAENTSPPLDRSKADYSAFAGRRMTPDPGNYRTTAQILRGGKILTGKSREITVR